MAIPDERAPTVRRRLKPAVVLVLLLVLSGGWWFALGVHWQAPAFSSGPLPSPSLNPLPRRFRVAFWNIHRGIGLDGRQDLARIAAEFRDCDLVGTGETLESQPAELGRQSGLKSLFVPSEITLLGDDYGQGILSKTMPISWSRTPFPRRDGNGYRCYVDLRFTGPQKQTLSVLVTHLDRRADRQDQLRILIAKFLELPPPVILMGDLNSKRTEPQLQELARQAGVTECLGEFGTGDLIRRRIDWIFVRGLKCHAAGLTPSDASDHPLAWAELEFDR